MPYRSYETRVRKYELGVIPDNVAAKFTNLKPLMLDGQDSIELRATTREWPSRRSPPQRRLSSLSMALTPLS